MSCNYCCCAAVILEIYYSKYFVWLGAGPEQQRPCAYSFSFIPNSWNRLSPTARHPTLPKATSFWYSTLVYSDIQRLWIPKLLPPCSYPTIKSHFLAQLLQAEL